MIIENYILDSTYSRILLVLSETEKTKYNFYSFTVHFVVQSFISPTNAN
jgi:hypothetical protein